MAHANALMYARDEFSRSFNIFSPVLKRNIVEDTVGYMHRQEANRAETECIAKEIVVAIAFRIAILTQ